MIEDEDHFLKYVRGDDPLGFVVRTHLYIEAALIQLIESALENPSEIDLDRLRFPSKVDLGIALGCLSGEARSGILSLNTLRNRVAHRLDYEVSQSDVDEIKASFGELMKGTYDAGVSTQVEPPPPDWEGPDLDLVMVMMAIAASVTAALTNRGLIPENERGGP